MPMMHFDESDTTLSHAPRSNALSYAEDRPA